MLCEQKGALPVIVYEIEQSYPHPNLHPFSMKHSACSGACTAMNWIVCLLLFLATITALVGVYQSHFGINGMVFGGSTGSLALIAFVASLTLWSKWMCKCLCMKEQ